MFTSLYLGDYISTRYVLSATDIIMLIAATRTIVSSFDACHCCSPSSPRIVGNTSQPSSLGGDPAPENHPPLSPQTVFKTSLKALCLQLLHETHQVQGKPFFCILPILNAHNV